MSNPRPIKVLFECQKLMKYMNLGANVEFHIRKWKVPNALVMVILTYPLNQLLILESLTLYSNGLSDFFEISASVFQFFMGSIQMHLIFWCLTNNNQTIIQTLDYIQEIVNQSNCLWFFCTIFRQILLKLLLI